MAASAEIGPIVYRLGHKIFNLGSRVRFPVGSHKQKSPKGVFLVISGYQAVVYTFPMIHFLFWLLLLVGSHPDSWNQKGFAIPDPSQLQLSAYKGGQWLLDYSKPYADPGVFWLASQMGESCGDPSLNQKLSARFDKEFSQASLEYGYKRLLDTRVDAHVSDAILAMHTNTFDDIIMPALYCDTYPLAENIQEKIFDIGHADHYALTHHYLALLLLQKNRCMVDDRLEKALDFAARKIAIEEEWSTFDDLYAERIAFLLYGGRSDLVKDAWISSLVDHQGAGGGWKTNRGKEFFGVDENPHTSVLALYALSRYGNICPFAKERSDHVVLVLTTHAAITRL